MNIIKAADAIETLITDNPDRLRQVLEKEQLIGWFVGQTMKMLNGNGNPKLILAILQAKLDEFREPTSAFKVMADQFGMATPSRK